MESAALGLDAGAAPSDPGAQPDPNMASMRRRAWAQSRDSWQEPESEPCSPQGPQQNPRDSAREPSEEPGNVPNKITSWLSECRTPLGASLDDQTASPTRGALKNGCSFEDDLSLGAEANHLQSSNKKTEPRFGLAADQKRSQYKERGRSMNSTGSGKSSTVSSVSEVLEQSGENPEEIFLNLRVSELLDLYEEDPEEILLNLGFGRDEPDMSAKVPSRFFNGSSSARGIDIKVYLGAQLQRMEVENPNYALTSRFRQIEVLTTVANEFIQLYSQVSGQPLQRISSKDQGDAGQGRKEDASPPQKRRAPALNAAKIIKKSISKHNLLMASGDSPDARTPQPQLNGHADHALTNGHAHSGPEQDGRAGESDHQAETVNQKHGRKKDSCSLATVTEETNGDGETDRLTDDSPAPNGPCQPQSADQQVISEEVEKNFTSTPEKAPHTLTSPQLAHLRTEKTDSFDMEEIQSNDDEALLPRISRNFDLLRTVSQQSDSSGFAEEPSVDCSSLKVQESSDSCDSETTVTSHASEDAATPLALDQPAFEMPESRKVEVEPGVVAVADGRSSSKEEEDEHVGSPAQVLQYSAHQLPRIRPDGSIENDAHDEEQSGVQAERLVLTEEQTDSGPQPPVDTQNLSSLPLEPEQTENSSEAAAVPETPTGEVCGEEQVQVEEPGDGLPFPPPPASPVLCALNRAKQIQLNREGLRSDPHHGTSHAGPGRGRRRGGIPLQRSSSLPSSLLSPSRVVSSVRIQFGRGQASCSQPRYSFRYTQENGGDEGKEEEEEEKKEANCLSTLIINQGASANQLAEASTPLKPIPRHLVRSSNSLHSPSPPPDWSPGGDVLSWSTQSVPDLSSTRQHLGPFHQSTMASASQQSANPGQVMFPYHSSPNPGPHSNPNSFAFGLNAPLQYPAPLHPYASLPNLLHPHQPHHHSSLTSLHHGAGSTLPQYDAPQNLHHASSAPHHGSLGNLHPGTPTMHQPGYAPPHGHQQPYHAAPHFASPYLGYNGYGMHPHLAYAHLYPMVSPEQQHLHHRGHTPPTAGLHPGLVPHASGMSSTELQLRRVLHDIRGTVQSLSQSRADTPDVFTERRAAPSSNQSLADFQQKRRSLNLFRNQMMDLELSIIRQQALVYKHLSPADRLEVEQLQSLRSAVREELQELEQQLEDRLMELTQQTQHKRLHREGSIDSLSTTSALRAMEPVSDLLREQLFLQSELSYDDRAPSTAPSTAPSSRSSRSSSPVRGRGGGGGGDQGQGTFRATINITPAPPPRPNANDGEEEKDDGDGGGDGGGGDGGGGGGGGVGEGDEFPQKGGETGVKVENLQQLIKEIRESVAQEVRQEIFSELMAAVSPRR